MIPNHLLILYSFIPAMRLPPRFFSGCFESTFRPTFATTSSLVPVSYPRSITPLGTPTVTVLNGVNRRRTVLFSVSTLGYAKGVIPGMASMAWLTTYKVY
ncbi:hypothetical protein ACFX2I_044513 [Malus domestica]